MVRRVNNPSGPACLQIMSVRNLRCGEGLGLPENKQLNGDRGELIVILADSELSRGGAPL